MRLVRTGLGNNGKQLEAVQERLKNLRTETEKAERKILDKIEKHFEISISAKQAKEVLTVEDLARLLHEMLAPKHPLWTHEEIVMQLQVMFSKWFAIPIEQRILPETEFIEGLIQMMPDPPARWKDDEENAS